MARVVSNREHRRSAIGRGVVRIKRAYAPPTHEDGRRVLIDRLWPRGRSRAAFALDDWVKDVAPSDNLRRWFGHEPARWEEFEKRYRAELRAPTGSKAIAKLVRYAREGTLTLIYGREMRRTTMPWCSETSSRMAFARSADCGVPRLDKLRSHRAR